jgi:ADP-ribose pyrophosphatase
MTDAQRDAIDAYLALANTRPELFTSREHRPIVLDPVELERYVEDTGATLGLVTVTAYFLVVVDLVRKTNAVAGPEHYTYVRMVPPHADDAPGVIIVPVIRNPELGAVGAFVLVTQERHATGTVELEFPRGACLRGEDPRDGALRELAEETGFIGASPIHLGDLMLDAGLSNFICSAYAVDVIAAGKKGPDFSEAIVENVILNRSAFLEKVASGACRDALSIAAFAKLDSLTIR